MGGGAKPKKAKTVPTKSAYSNVDEANFSGPYGGATSTITPYVDTSTGKRVNRTKIDTEFSLNPELQRASDTATTGLNANLGYLQRDPNARLDYLRSGQDPYYSLLNEQAQRQYDQNLGRLKINAGDAGAGNSTAAGAAYGTLMRDKQLMDNQNLLAGLNFGNENARADAQLNLGAIGNFANLVYPLGSAANAQLNTGLSDQSSAASQTAAARNAAEMQYAQAMNQYRQQQQSAMWSAIGAAFSSPSQIGQALGNIGQSYRPTSSPSFGAVPPASGGGFGGGGFGGGDLSGTLGNFDPSTVAMAVA